MESFGGASRVPFVVPSASVARLLAAVALPLALFAALAASVGPSAGARQAGDPGPVGTITTQTFTCPDNYTGTGYLTDCEPGAPYEVILGYPDGTTLSAFSAGDGFATFAGNAAGEYGITVAENVDTNRFYLACFDGTGVFLFDGAGRDVAFDLSDGDSISCRFYVTPLVAASPAPSAGDGVDGAGLEVQTRLYPEEVELTPAFLLANCAGVDDVLIQLNPGATYDESTAIDGRTAGGGFVGYDNLDPGTYTLAIGVPGDFADFSFACFDTTFGPAVFVKEGTTNVTTLTFEGDTQTRCRWYILPVDAGAPDSPAPSAKPTAKPTVKPSASAGPVIGLPSTGTGDAAGTPVPGLFAWVILALGLGAAAVASRRLAARG